MQNYFSLLKIFFNGFLREYCSSEENAETKGACYTEIERAGGNRITEQASLSKGRTRLRAANIAVKTTDGLISCRENYPDAIPARSIRPMQNAH